MLKYKKTKEEISMKIKNLITGLMCILAIFVSSACSPANINKEPKYEFVGIAIYQNSKENTKWINVKNDPSLINNMIETQDDKIVYKDEPAFLFYLYTQAAISTSTLNDSYISNTTRDEVTINNNTINFKMERIYEQTDVLIYFVYKNKDSYHLNFIKEQDNISNESETIVIDIENESFNKVKIDLEINLSTKKEY